MAKQFTISLDHIIKELSWEIKHLPQEAANILITSKEVNRPGLVLNGYTLYFDPERIQLLGLMEYAFLEKMIPEEREARLAQLCALHPPAIVVTRDQPIFPELLIQCKKHGVALLSSSETTSDCMASLIGYLNVQLAPRITRHGVLVEVYGEGILITGDSGIGKSECAIELVKRGHRLIADDAVEIRRTSSKALVGSAPDNIRYYVELRGVGIVNVRRIFGMGAVKMTEKIDLVVELENWNPETVYDRMGLENEAIDILGIEVPKMTIPVKPGRNLAVILEVAAMNNRQKKLGYNAAQELMHNLGMETGEESPRPVPSPNWTF
ncbi:MAG: HPr(Ser) kinase/phosphatase [Clostridia bacterium]|nr:HPr(Ser) kinase/phosphatase [Clostridia bacterium]